MSCVKLENTRAVPPVLWDVDSMSVFASRSSPLSIVFTNSGSESLEAGPHNSYCQGKNWIILIFTTQATVRNLERVTQQWWHVWPANFAPQAHTHRLKIALSRTRQLKVCGTVFQPIKLRYLCSNQKWSRTLQDYLSAIMLFLRWCGSSGSSHVFVVVPSQEVCGYFICQYPKYIELTCWNLSFLQKA